MVMFSDRSDVTSSWFQWVPWRDFFAAGQTHRVHALHPDVSRGRRILFAIFQVGESKQWAQWADEILIQRNVHQPGTRQFAWSAVWTLTRFQLQSEEPKNLMCVGLALWLYVVISGFRYGFYRALDMVSVGIYMDLETLLKSYKVVPPTWCSLV
jgi:hypothetical protein